MLISVFQCHAPRLDIGNLKVAEGVTDGDDVRPSRCAVLQDGPRGRIAIC